MNLKEQEKSKFLPDWWRGLSYQFETDYMKDIYSKLKDASKSAEIYPNRTDIYKEFGLCDWNNVLVCFVIGEPIICYKQSKTWQNISRLIELECFDGLNLNLEDNPDKLIEQGIFFLPVVRTCDKENKINHNQLGWQKFSREVIKYLNKSLNKICFVYEDSCIEFMQGIDTNWHKIIKLEKECFKKIKEYLKQEYNTNVNW